MWPPARKTTSSGVVPSRAFGSNYFRNSTNYLDNLPCKKEEKTSLVNDQLRWSHLHFHLYSGLQFISFHSVFHSFHGLINSTSSPALSVWVLIAQQVEHCSANAEVTGSNPVEAPNNFFSGQLRNCLNSDSTAIVTYSFSKNEIKKPGIISIHFIQHQKKALLSNLSTEWSHFRV